MSYYFGFVPSQMLSDTIKHAYALIENNSDERYDLYRDKITHMVSKELLDVMLVKLIEAMPNESERKTHLIKLSHTIETTSDKVIDTILTPTDNADVLASFDFFDKNVVKHDETGQMRIGFPLSDELAGEIFACFANVHQGNGKDENARLAKVFSELSNACLQHFLLDFTKTLPLNRLKRGAISLADGVLKKGISLALNRLIPQMPQESLERFTKYYQSQIFKA